MQSYIYIYTVNENTLAPTIENLDIYIYILYKSHETFGNLFYHCNENDCHDYVG